MIGLTEFHGMEAKRTLFFHGMHTEFGARDKADRMTNMQIITITVIISGVYVGTLFTCLFRVATRFESH